MRASTLCWFHSLISTQTPSSALRHPSLKEEGAGKRCSECDGYPDLSEGADRVGGQKRGDTVAYIYNHILAESGGEGAGKRCSVCCMVPALTLGQQHFDPGLGRNWPRPNLKNSI